MKLVAAEDAPLVRERLALILSEIEGAEVVGLARDGTEALELFMTHRPDVMILDIRMPKVNGIEVLEQIRRTDAATVVIVLTNDVSSQHRQRCMKAGADYFMHKSREFAMLASVLAEVRQRLGGDPTRGAEGLAVC